MHGRGRRIDRKGRGHYFNRLRDFPGFDCDAKADRLVDQDFRALDLRHLEPLLLHTNGVQTRYQGWKEEGPVVVRLACFAANRAGNRDRCVRDSRIRRVIDNPDERTTR